MVLNQYYWYKKKMNNSAVELFLTLYFFFCVLAIISTFSVCGVGLWVCETIERRAIQPNRFCVPSHDLFLTFFWSNKIHAEWFGWTVCRQSKHTISRLSLCLAKPRNVFVSKSQMQREMAGIMPITFEWDETLQRILNISEYLNVAPVPGKVSYEIKIYHRAATLSRDFVRFVRITWRFELHMSCSTFVRDRQIDCIRACKQFAIHSRSFRSICNRRIRRNAQLMWHSNVKYTGFVCDWRVCGEFGRNANKFTLDVEESVLAVVTFSVFSKIQ